MTVESIESAVAGYYSRALARYGPTHRGVDWSSRESHELRFNTLLDGVDWGSGPSVLDFGCGFGGLASHLDRRGVGCAYVGYDIAPTMIAAARASFPGRPDRRFTADDGDLEPADVVIASGIFNVRLKTPPAVWERYVGDTLARLSRLARRRLAFNMLPPASPPGRARAHLHYADPATVGEFCRDALGRNVELRQDYGLWEFTVILT
jgi:SAM-dependent methyltransferase